MCLTRSLARRILPLQMRRLCVPRPPSGVPAHLLGSPPTFGSCSRYREGTSAALSAAECRMHHEGPFPQQKQLQRLHMEHATPACLLIFLFGQQQTQAVAAICSPLYCWRCPALFFITLTDSRLPAALVAHAWQLCRHNLALAGFLQSTSAMPPCLLSIYCPCSQ